MLLQYKTDDRYLVGTLCSFLANCYPTICFSWIPFLSCLCVFCPDEATHDLIETDISSELNVKHYNPSVK